LLDIARLERETALTCLHHTDALRWGADSHGFLGVILFLAPTLTVQDIALLDLPGHCHRGAVVVDVVKAGQPLRLIGTHLSLSQPLRMAQMRIIGQHMFRRDRRQTILCGDLNEWRPWGGLALSARVTGQRFTGPARATFPINRPFLPLDRILTTAPGRVTRARVLDGPGIRRVSDHRPLAGQVSLG
jgi:endonuclease/exonuclease/phosphatase family metal-dependent hydrolase